MLRLLQLLLCIIISVNAFFGGDESRYIKKFAMMKVYESCFGDDVVREVREEMRQAAMRCAAAGSVGSMPPLAPDTTSIPILHSPPTTAQPSTTQSPHRRQPTPNTAAMTAESLHRLQTLLQGLRTNVAANIAHTSMQQNQQTQPQLQQQKPVIQHSQPEFQPHPYYPMPYPPYPHIPPPPSPYIYPQPYVNPYYPPFNPYFAQRASRDMRGNPSVARVRNVTCVMQELGYLDSDLEPNYSGIISRIERLPLQNELRNDMVEAVNYCKKLSQCVPEPDPEKMQVSSDFSKPMIFFRCYKQKKLEACVLKDVRERFMSHMAAAGNSADDPEIPDHNGLVDDEDEPHQQPTLRFRSRAGSRSRSRSGRNSFQKQKISNTARAAEIADVIFEDALGL